MGKKTKLASTQDSDPSLLSKQAMGGINGDKGYAAQRAWALTQIPVWIGTLEFDSLLMEGAGDVDVRFKSKDLVFRNYAQVKDYLLTYTQFRSILNEFTRRKANSGQSYNRFSIVCKGFIGDLKALVTGIDRVRNYGSFYDQGGESTDEATRRDVAARAQRCKLSDADVKFLFDHVTFVEAAGLDDPSHIQDVVVGKLATLYASATGPLLTRAFKELYHLVTSSSGHQLTRQQLVQVLNESVTGSQSSPFPLLDPVRLNDLPGLVRAAQQYLEAFNQHPNWRFEVSQTSEGHNIIRFSPRTPQSAYLHPLRLNIRPSVPDKGLEDFVRELYATGRPVRFEVAEMSAVLGDEVLIKPTPGELEISLPPEAIDRRPITLCVLNDNGVPLDYVLVLGLRAFDGVVYGDNEDQVGSPIRVRIQFEPHAAGNVAVGSIEMRLDEAAQPHAASLLKFSRFMQAASRPDAQLLLKNPVSEFETPLTGGSITIDDRGASDLARRIELLVKIVDLQRKLSVTFAIPDEIRVEEATLVVRLWSLYIAGAYDTSSSAFIGSLTVRELRAAALYEALNDGALYRLAYTAPEEEVELFGVALTLPERRVLVDHVRFLDCERLREQLREMPSYATLKIATTDPAIMTETFVDEELSPDQQDLAFLPMTDDKNG